MTSFNTILFDRFETLDAFGPIVAIGNLQSMYDIKYYSLNGGIVKSKQKVKVHTLPFSDMDINGILLIPGGMGIRSLVDNEAFVRQIKHLSEKAAWVLTVCTGSALLAKTGLLDGIKATSNKMSFEWVSSNGTHVNWVKKHVG